MLITMGVLQVLQCHNYSDVGRAQCFHGYLAGGSHRSSQPNLFLSGIVSSGEDRSEAFASAQLPFLAGLSTVFHLKITALRNRMAVSVMLIGRKIRPSI